MEVENMTKENLIEILEAVELAAFEDLKAYVLENLNDAPESVAAIDPEYCRLLGRWEALTGLAASIRRAEVQR
jgi:hypothetical protein